MGATRACCSSFQHPSTPPIWAANKTPSIWYRACTNIEFFPPWSQAAVFCPAHLQHYDFEQLANSSSNQVHMGCQVGKAYRVVLLEGDSCFSVLALLLAFTTQPRKKSNQKGDEPTYDKVRRMSSPRLACPISWSFGLASAS